jgi:hypothetical protein
MAEINTKFNIAKMEYIMSNRKKKRRKINILTNLFDVIRSMIKITGLNMVINKGNLFHLLKLHKMMHNNNRYFDSIHDKKFQFYSQLIERYRQILTSRKSTYLNLTSSNLNPNHYLKKGNIEITLHTIITEYFNLIR